VKYRHDRNSLPINDQHRSLWTPLLIPIPTRMIIRVNLSCCVLFLLLRDMLQIPEVRFYASPWINTCPLCKLPRYRFCSLYSFLCSGIPVIKSPCVWPDDDGYRNTERAREYLSIVRGANPNLELSTLLDILFHEPVSRRNCHPFTDDV